MLSQPAVHVLSMVLEADHALTPCEEQLGPFSLYQHRANHKMNHPFLDPELTSCPVSSLSLVTAWVAISYILASRTE